MPKKTPPAPGAAVLRAHLRSLADKPGSDGAHTLQHAARENHVPVGKLRQFRDGRDEALNAGIVRMWSKILGSDADLDLPDDPLDRQWLRTLLAVDSSRQARYTHYKTIDETRPEAGSALDCWSDIVCTGSVGEDRYGGGFEPNYTGDKARERKLLGTIAAEINTHILPPSELLMLVRDLAKDGDVFEQIGLAREKGEPYIAKLQNMPTATMHYLRRDDGTIDPARAFQQILPGKSEPTAFFPQWKIVHFANRTSRADLYGKSIFWNCLRSWIQVEAMEAGMMIRRLERAPFRLKHILDVSHCASQQEIEKTIDAQKQRHRKVKTVDGNRNFHNQRISMPADEDLFVARRSNESPADIEGLQGDANLNDIADFLHFWNKWLSGLGPPKAHLGYEGDVTRSVGTDLHIVFARKGRRMQLKVIQGLVHLYWVALILRNLDPRSIPFTIYPPAVGTRDELLRAQVELAHATTVRYLAQAVGTTGKQPGVKWFLRYVMRLDDECIDALELEDVQQTKPGGAGPGGASQNRGNEPTPKEARELAAAALASPDVEDAVLKTRFFLNERAIMLRKPELLRGGVAEQYEWMRPVDPFGASFEAVVHSLGRKPSELRRLG